MNAASSEFITNIACGVLANFSTEAVKAFFGNAIDRKPSMNEKIHQIGSSKDIELVFREALGIIDASAGAGAIEIDGALLEAVRGIKFDHEHGTVTIAGCTIAAPTLVTGGAASATGKTIIEAESTLISKGASISLGTGSSILMTGGAKITQN